MAGGNPVGAKLERVIEEGLELDFRVAQHVGIGRAPRLVFRKEVAEYAVLVFGGKIHGFDVDADQVRNRNRIDQVLA